MRRGQRLRPGGPGLTHLLQQLNISRRRTRNGTRPITQQTLKMAMEASPHLREIKDSLARHAQGGPEETRNYAVGERGWKLQFDIFQSTPVDVTAQGEGKRSPRA